MLGFKEKRAIQKEIKALYKSLDSESGFKAKRALQKQIKELYAKLDVKVGSPTQIKGDEALKKFLKDNNIDTKRKGYELIYSSHIIKPIVKTLLEIVESSKTTEEKVSQIKEKLNDGAVYNKDNQTAQFWIHQRSKEQGDYELEEYVGALIFGFEHKVAPYAKDISLFCKNNTKVTVDDIRGLVDGIKSIELDEKDETVNIKKAKVYLLELDEDKNILEIEENGLSLFLNLWNGEMYASLNTVTISYSNNDYQTKERATDLSGKNDDEKIYKLTKYLYDRVSNLHSKFNLNEAIFKECKNTINMFYKGHTIDADLVFSKNTTPSSSGEFFNIKNRESFSLGTIIERPNAFLSVIIDGNFTPNKKELFSNIERVISEKKYITINGDTRYYNDTNGKNLFNKAIDQSKDFDEFISLERNKLNLKSFKENKNLRNTSLKEIYKGFKLGGSENKAIDAPLNEEITISLSIIKDTLEMPELTFFGLNSITEHIPKVKKEEDSLLKDELYKEVISLYEDAINSMESKVSLDGVGGREGMIRVPATNGGLFGGIKDPEYRKTILNLDPDDFDGFDDITDGLLKVDELIKNFRG